MIHKSNHKSLCLCWHNNLIQITSIFSCVQNKNRALKIKISCSLCFLNYGKMYSVIICSPSTTVQIMTNTSLSMILKFFFSCLIPDVMISVHSPNNHFQAMTAAVATTFWRKATAASDCQLLLDHC